MEFETETGQRMAGLGADDGPMDPTHPVHPTDSAIRAERLVRQFNGVTAVDEVDLDIPRGEIYGFLGPNGAGKTTTLRVLCTLLTPTAGRAVAAGHAAPALPGDGRLRLGLAPPRPALRPN